MSTEHTQLMKEIHEAILEKYGSFENPVYNNSLSPYLPSTGGHAWGDLSKVIGELDNEFTVVDDTDSNIDACIALVIYDEDRKCVCRVDLSFVGKYAAAYKIVARKKEMKYLASSQNRLFKPEKKILSILEKHGIRPLPVEILKTKVDFKRANLEEGEPYFIYNVLFSDYMPPGFD